MRWKNLMATLSQFLIERSAIDNVKTEIPRNYKFVSYTITGSRGKRIDVFTFACWFTFFGYKK